MCIDLWATLAAAAPFAWCNEDGDRRNRTIIDAAPLNLGTAVLLPSLRRLPMHLTIIFFWGGATLGGGAWTLLLFTLLMTAAAANGVAARAAMASHGRRRTSKHHPRVTRLPCGSGNFAALSCDREPAMNGLSRRELIAALAAASAASAMISRSAFATNDDSRGRPRRANPVFAHGVASGDSLQDRVILWTRISPARFEDEVEVRWRVARDPRMRREVCKGSFKTDIRRDFTVKVDVQDLEPGSTYYYRFESRGARSPVGRTKTLAQGRVEAARIAFASCSNFPFGYFNAYARIAERADLDLVLHLGNYIYE